jgi:hypothetical protein
MASTSGGGSAGNRCSHARDAMTASRSSAGPEQVAGSSSYPGRAGGATGAPGGPGGRATLCDDSLARSAQARRQAGASNEWKLSA